MMERIAMSSLSINSSWEDFYQVLNEKSFAAAEELERVKLLMQLKQGQENTAINQNLVKATWALVIVTIALVLVTIGTIIVTKYF